MSPADQPRSTRKERRNEARARRGAAEAQENQRKLRRRRLVQLGGVAVLAISAITFAVATGSHGPSTGPPPGPGQETHLVDSLLAGVPQSGNVLGNPNAPVKLEYFGDLECPICREFTLGTLPSVITDFVRQGKLKIEYRSMETATRESTIFREQQAAALSAGRQNLMWYFVELFYHE